MDRLDTFNRRYNLLSKISASFFYSIAVAIALNLFWGPGHMYSSGITGFAQLINTLSERYLPFTLTTSAMYFALNVPLLLVAWFKIGHKFTFFTIITVILGSIMMRVLQPVNMHVDPLVCAIFGGMINGLGTGFALKNGISTGGLDIVGIVVQKKTGTSYGKVSIFINLVIIAAAGIAFGWNRALYSALTIFINGRVIDAVYTQHQKLQVTIVTDQPQAIIDGIQEKMHRGITIFHDVEGAYSHIEKKVLITVINRYDMYDVLQIVQKSDPYAFMSVTEVERVYGTFKEQEIV
ncbi:YitT family protein [Lactobacillus sp. ESL0236]|uniref:YitT family protein n=1 Tax=unclassified Lactobacillus TaxID=2620435 RepID=UPI000EFC6B1E|nr:MULTISPECIES: YitT family protein [unclassified Lactobacillus]RMC39996.1 YitT family protein [Lactobacillus sp. ESL0237]RMC44157.1 YitT family protein [Lactobacillus sp. ESL0234]RMC45485.1 YitT family protein [Lactobacillus sp. ESL0236]